MYVCATKAMLLSHSRIDSFAPRTLNLLSVTQFLDQSSRLKPDRAVGDQDSDWQYRVSLSLASVISPTLQCFALWYVRFSDQEVVSVTPSRPLHMMSDSVTKQYNLLLAKG